MNIYQKMAALRAELPAMKKDQKANTGTYAYKFFDINQMIEVLEPLLAKHSLAVFQPLTNVNGRPAIKTIVADKNGIMESHEETVTIPDLDDSQKMGGAVTYFRRYSLQSLFFMEAEDDDGNVASGRTTTPPKGDYGVKLTKSEEDNLPF